MIGGEGQFLYNDDDHLNLEGGRLVARLILSELHKQRSVR